MRGNRSARGMPVSFIPTDPRFSSVSMNTNSWAFGFDTSCSTPGSRKYDCPATISSVVSPWAPRDRRRPVVIGTIT